MNTDDEMVVEYIRRDSQHHDILPHTPALPAIAIDFEGAPENARAGIAVKLLAASLLYCFASTLAAALAARGVNPRSLTGRAAALKGKDDIRRTRVQRIDVEMTVEIDDAEEPILDKCRRIMEHGCLIAYTLEEAITIRHTIRRL